MYDCKMLIIIIFQLTAISAYTGLKQRTPNECGRYKWQCDNGQCISDHNLCDGVINCNDQSDESSLVCSQIRCPAYSFRCTYGACVRGTSECDGIRDCADNSDEETINCVQQKKSQSIKDICPKYTHFQCNSGECILIEHLCDGKIHCQDKSDETEKHCSSVYCPTYAFQCNYGGCIRGDGQCDKIKDCADGSDELNCGYTIEQNRPTDFCLVPTIPENGNIVFATNDSMKLKKGQIVESRTTIKYQCNEQYKLLGTSADVCVNGLWVLNQKPKCQKFCDKISIDNISMSISCELEGLSIYCNRMLPPKTRVFMSCKMGYEKPVSAITDFMICNDSGEWSSEPFECEQTCGVPDLNPYTIDGDVTEIMKVPWHAIIYSGNNYRYVCGGSIISSRIIISAAHCFWDSSKNILGDKSTFTVAVGKSVQEIRALEQTVPQFFKVSELIIKDEYQHTQGSYSDDIAVVIVSNFIIFKDYILPVCIDSNINEDNKFIESGKIGKLARWDVSTSENKKLNTLQLPSVDQFVCKRSIMRSFQSLLTTNKFCAGMLNGPAPCSGDGGTGLMFPRNINGTDKYFIYGVLTKNSLYTTYGSTCDRTKYNLFTNIYQYIDMIPHEDSQLLLDPR